MHRRNYTRVSELFLRAVDLPTSEREAYLEEVCRDDPELRTHVTEMLRHDRQPPDALQTGGFRPSGLGEAAPLPDRIGAYEIVELIGEGGMGVVYRAVQSSPIRRQVAVKIILPGFETRRVVARFDSEREALARMDHPGIARVLDAGSTESGLPYFVMEYVDGEPITDYCERLQLSLDQRLELFGKVCDAVQHAHQNAIIHRDLKPSNILVTERDGTPTPKIIDFGVAKALGDADRSTAPITEAGRPIGTPGYMSPEQAAPDGRGVDTRTDVYSLGVLLYELLAGVQPFDPKQLGHAGSDGFRQTVLEREPLPPSSHFRALTGRKLAQELDWITLKALRKEPDLRYTTALAMFADVERYLCHEPVLAGPPGVPYRVRKFVRRHRVGMALTTAVVITIALFAAAALRQAKLASQEGQRARQEAETVQELTEFLVADLFQLNHGIGARVDRISARELVIGSTEKALSKLADRPLLRARMQHTLGNVQRRMGFTVRALPLLEESCAGLAAQAGSSDPNSLRCASDLARVHLDLRRFEEAEELFVSVLAARRADAGDDAPDTLRAMSDLAYLYKAWGRHDQAALLFEEAVAGLQRQLGQDHPETLIASGFLAGVYLELDRLDELEPLLLRLTTIAPQVLGEDHLETHAAWYNLGCLQARRGERDKALDSLRMAIDRGFNPGFRLRADPDLEALANDPRFERLEQAAANNAEASWSQFNQRGELAVTRGDYDEAASLFRDVVEAARRQPGGLGLTEARVAMDFLSFVYLKQGRYDEAEPILLEWLQLHRDSPRPRADEKYILWTLAQCALARGRIDLAIERIARARSGSRQLSFASRYLEAAERSLLGDRRGALDLLSRAADLGRSESFKPEADLAFEALRGDPEFDEIVARMAQGRIVL